MDLIFTEYSLGVEKTISGAPAGRSNRVVLEFEYAFNNETDQQNKVKATL